MRFFEEYFKAGGTVDGLQKVIGDKVMRKRLIEMLCGEVDRILLGEADWDERFKRELEAIVAAYHNGGIDWDPSKQLFTPRPEPVEGTEMMLIPVPYGIKLGTAFEALGKAGISTWKFTDASLDKLNKLKEPPYAKGNVWTPTTQNPLATYADKSSRWMYKNKIQHLGCTQRLLMELIWNHIHGGQRLDVGAYLTLTSTRLSGGVLNVDCSYGLVYVDGDSIGNHDGALRARLAVS